MLLRDCYTSSELVPVLRKKTSYTNMTKLWKELKVNECLTETTFVQGAIPSWKSVLGVSSVKSQALPGFVASAAARGGLWNSTFMGILRRSWSRPHSFRYQRISLAIQIANAACVLETTNDITALDEFLYSINFDRKSGSWRSFFLSFSFGQFENSLKV